MRTFLSFAFLLTATAALMAGTAMAQDITIPESWAGVWETTTTEMDCVTMEVISVSTSLDTFCTGTSFIPEDPNGEFPELVCEGMADDTTIHVDCSGTLELTPDCTFTLGFLTDATRSGDTSQGVTINAMTFTGTCFVPDSCTRREYTAVRLSDDPGCDQTPVFQASWGSIKSIYR